MQGQVELPGLSSSGPANDSAAAHTARTSAHQAEKLAPAGTPWCPQAMADLAQLRPTAKQADVELRCGVVYTAPGDAVHRVRCEQRSTSRVQNTNARYHDSDRTRSSGRRPETGARDCPDVAAIQRIRLQNSDSRVLRVRFRHHGVEVPVDFVGVHSRPVLKTWGTEIWAAIATSGIATMLTNTIAALALESRLP